jgi:hypothetical protein
MAGVSSITIPATSNWGRKADFGLIGSLGDVINKWRRSLDLEDVAAFDGPLLAERLRVPFTYCWSPTLIPKPADWGRHIGKNMDCGY